MNLREATKKELQELANIEHEATGVEVEIMRDFLANSFVSVTDRYITDGPGYAGKVISVVWSGSPTIYNIYTVNSKNALERLEPEL